MVNGGLQAVQSGALANGTVVSGTGAELLVFSGVPLPTVCAAGVAGASTKFTAVVPEVEIPCGLIVFRSERRVSKIGQARSNVFAHLSLID